MSDTGWEEKFEAPKFIHSNLADKWDGEDEEYDVKDNWDDEDPPEEKENEAPPSAAAGSQPKKKNLKQILAEKEELKKKEEEERKKELEEKQKELTPEEQLAERLRIQKLQEESDFEFAKETFGIQEAVVPAAPSSFESLDPSSKEDFDELKKVLVTKLQSLENSALYLPFLEDLMRDLCINFEAEDVKKLSSALNALANEKVKSQKSKAKKKAGKKAALKVDRGNNYLEDYAAGDDFDDFL